MHRLSIAASARFKPYDPKRLQGISAYQEISRDFAKRDRLQFTAPSRELGVANWDMGTIQKIVEDRVTVKMDGPADKVVTFRAHKTPLIQRSSFPSSN